jgi:hypothetical protein
MTASALEQHLNAIEGKVDELLASFEKQNTAATEAESANGTDPSQSDDQTVDSSNNPPK